MTFAGTRLDWKPSETYEQWSTRKAMERSEAELQLSVKGHNPDASPPVPVSDAKPSHG